MTLEKFTDLAGAGNLKQSITFFHNKTKLKQVT